MVERGAEGQRECVRQWLEEKRKKCRVLYRALARRLGVCLGCGGTGGG